MTDAEKINALIKKLETGATCQSDAMRAFDAVKAAAIDHPQGSISRDIFEGFIDDIRDEIEALKAQEKPDTSFSLIKKWFEKCRDARSGDAKALWSDGLQHLLYYKAQADKAQEKQVEITQKVFEKIFAKEGIERRLEIRELLQKLGLKFIDGGDHG